MLKSYLESNKLQRLWFWTIFHYITYWIDPMEFLILYPSLTSKTSVQRSVVIKQQNLNDATLHFCF